MTTIYMDESGDLGFSLKNGSSKYFIVTFLFVENTKRIRNIVKSTFKSLKKIHKHKSGVLHAYKETTKTRKRLLTKLSKSDTKVMCIYLNKENVYTHLQNEKNILYNYVTNILLDRVYKKRYINDSTLKLIAERKDTNKFLNENFKSYLKRQSNGKYNKNIEIEIKTPHEDKCLQAADFVSWALFRKYEAEDDSYYNIFQEIVIEEKGLFD